MFQTANNCYITQDMILNIFKQHAAHTEEESRLGFESIIGFDIGTTEYIVPRVKRKQNKSQNLKKT
jgi:hypothetical protein